MSVSNGIVSKTDSTSISEINSLIGAGSNDLGTICKHSNINPYSKYKPVRKAQVGTMTDDNFKSVNWGYYFPIKCNLTQCLTLALGLTTDYSNMQTLDGNAYSKPTANAVDMGNAWYYLKPTGGADSPYRLGDFRGYVHDANYTICTMVVGSTIDINQQSGQTLTWSLFTSGAGGVDLLDMISDYTTNGGYNRWGIVIVKDNYTPTSTISPSSIPCASVHYIYSKKRASNTSNYPPITFGGDDGQVPLSVLKELFWSSSSGTKFKIFPILVNDPSTAAEQYETATSGKNLGLTNACVMPFNEDTDNTTKKGYITVQVVNNTSGGSGSGSGITPSEMINIYGLGVRDASFVQMGARYNLNFTVTFNNSFAGRDFDYYIYQYENGVQTNIVGHGVYTSVANASPKLITAQFKSAPTSSDDVAYEFVVTANGVKIYEDPITLEY